MGFCNFYRRFIEGFSKIGKPLYNVTKKNQKWNWTDKEQQVFDKLRTRLTSAPVLVHYDPTRRIMIETDALKYVSAGILSQECEDGKWRPVAYRSKTMKPAECNYDVHDKELLAIVQALKEWRRYVAGSQHKIRILTDHKNLVPFMTTKELNERQIRWSETLSQYDIKLESRHGKDGGKPDALTWRSMDKSGPEDERITQK